MTNEELPFCECGCCKPVKHIGDRFIHGHNKRKRYLGKLPLCECGCGKEVKHISDRFIKYHHLRGTTHLVPATLRKQISKSRKLNPQTKEDIVRHHYIYDHSDLSKNTIEMTRSDHSKLHALFRKLGYIVPHININ